MSATLLPLYRSDSAFLRSRSRRFFQVFQYNWIVLSFWLSACLAKHFSFLIAVIVPGRLWTPESLIVVLLLVPTLLGVIPPNASVWGLCWPSRPFTYRDNPKTRELRTLRVCLVTKGDNVKTVYKSVECWTALHHLDSRVKFHVLLDLPADLSFFDKLPGHVNLDLVPVSFRPKCAKFKARALEWFRRQWELSDTDWILHLDEETQIDEYALQSCLDFIERGTEHVGMGLIMFNSSSHWKNAFLTVCEITRLSDDFGRFQFLSRVFNRNPFGWMHGAFILVNGAVENDVTWDTACVAEDFWFAQKASNLGYRFGVIDAIAREQPPYTFSDFVKQRRRWYSGILGGANIVARINIFSLAWSLVRHIYLVTCLLRKTRPLVPHWLFVWLVWEVSAYTFTTTVACVMQDLDSPDVALAAVPLHILQTLLIAPVCQFVEGCVFLTCLVRRAHGFHVIKKI